MNTQHNEATHGKYTDYLILKYMYINTGTHEKYPFEVYKNQTCCLSDMTIKILLLLLKWIIYYKTNQLKSDESFNIFLLFRF